MNINQKTLEEQPIITREIHDFELSVEFNSMCRVNTFQTFGDILIYGTSELLRKPGFNYRMLKELYALLKAMNKQHMLKD